MSTLWCLVVPPWLGRSTVQGRYGLKTMLLLFLLAAVVFSWRVLYTQYNQTHINCTQSTRKYCEQVHAAPWGGSLTNTATFTAIKPPYLPPLNMIEKLSVAWLHFTLILYDEHHNVLKHQASYVMNGIRSLYECRVKAGGGQQLLVPFQGGVFYVRRNKLKGILFIFIGSIQTQMYGRAG